VKRDNFTNIPFEASTLDIYYVRQSILLALKENITLFKGKLLDIGCGKMPYKEFIVANSTIEKYVGLDIEGALNYDADIKPDYLWDGITMPFADNSFDSAFGTEVLEHCARPEIILNEVYRVLKPGGVLFFTVPFLWPLHEVPNDAFRYTPFILQSLLKDAGFVKIQLEAIGGWHASMAQMLGLWVRRSPMGDKKRKLLSVGLKPVIRYLLKMERFSRPEFNEGQMITGLSGIAYKETYNQEYIR